MRNPNNKIHIFYSCGFYKILSKICHSLMKIASTTRHEHMIDTMVAANDIFLLYHRELLLHNKQLYTKKIPHLQKLEPSEMVAY